MMLRIVAPALFLAACAPQDPPMLIDESDNRTSVAGQQSTPRAPAARDANRR